MDNIPPDFVMPSEADWQRSAEIGEREVRKALGSRLLRRLERKSPATFDVAVLFGALVAVGQALHVYTNKDDPSHMERLAMMYLRGAIRGADGPVHEDGTPYA